MTLKYDSVISISPLERAMFRSDEKKDGVYYPRPEKDEDCLLHVGKFQVSISSGTKLSALLRAPQTSP
jgi:hypothetical protein